MITKDKRALEVAICDKIIAGRIIDEIEYKAPFEIFKAASVTTVGGAASEDFTIAGVLATDLVIAMVKTQGAAPKVIQAAFASAGKITVIFDADPSNDHVISYFIVRAS